MNRSFAAAAALCTAGTITMAASIFPYRAETETLPNGLRVILIPMESPGLIAYYTIVRTGSRDEVEPGKSGFAHFFEHMMFRGTKTYPGPVYDSLVTSIGASANAYTTDDYTAYHLNFAKEDLGLVMTLESDRFQNLWYEKPAFQTEAGAVYGEYKKNITSPYMLLFEKVQDLAYDRHTYKHTTMGVEADIRAMPEGFDYSRSFFDRFYRPDNTVLLIAGDIDTKQTLEMVRRLYGPWKQGHVPPAIVPEPPQEGERAAVVDYPGRTLPILNIGYKGDAFDPANRNYVAAILLGQLAFGESSDLYKELVIREQKVEWISPSIPMNRDVPLFEITSMVKKEDDLQTVRDRVYSTLARFQESLVDSARLNDLKRRQKYSFLMNLDTPNKVAAGLARIVALTGGIDAVDPLYTAFDAITPEDVRTAARTYFVPDRRTVVVLKGARQ